MSRLVFFLEEPSARKFLGGFLPAIGFQKWEYEIPQPFEGKGDLLKYFAEDLRDWNTPGDKYIVLVDQDTNDCRCLKNERIHARARDKCPAQAGELRVRIACWELEAWYLGDLSALRGAYPEVRDMKWRKIPKTQAPDAVRKPSGVLGKIIPGFHKPTVAEKMGKILGGKCAETPDYYDKGSADCNRSASFRCFAATMFDLLRELRGE